MAVLSAINPTLLDVVNAMNPDSSIATVAEILNQTNDIMKDIPMKEGNLPTGNQTVVRTGLPTPTWRKLYGGVQPTKSARAKVTDNCGMLEAYAEIDQALADIANNAAAFRLSEARAHIEGIAQEFADTLFYGNDASEPEAFTGLAPRFNALSTSTAKTAENVINGTGASNLTSVWLIGWGDQSAHGIYPQGSVGGLKHTDKGVVTVENVDGASGRAEMYRDHFRMDCGLSVPDWRFIVRICNLDYTALTKNAGTGADLIDLMTQALELVPETDSGSVRWGFYMNRTVRSFLRRQITNKVASSTLTMDTVAGRRVMMFEEVPVRRCDKIVNSETAVA